jgi:hypothetical protein
MEYFGIFYEHLAFGGRGFGVFNVLWVYVFYGQLENIFPFWFNVPKKSGNPDVHIRICFQNYLIIVSWLNKVMKYEIITKRGKYTLLPQNI